MGMKKAETRCAWCGRVARPARSEYLRRLFPSRTFCSGCGLMQIHCDCRDRVA